MKKSVVLQVVEGARAHQNGSAVKAPKDIGRKDGVAWSATHTMRLPHKVGLPLGSGGGGDNGCGA